MVCRSSPRKRNPDRPFLSYVIRAPFLGKFWGGFDIGSGGQRDSGAGSNDLKGLRVYGASPGM